MCADTGLPLEASHAHLQADPREAALREWVANTLGSKVIAWEQASGDASFRRYLRVTTDATSFIAMDAPPQLEDCRPYIHVAGLLQAAGVNVPEILAVDSARGFMLLSDLGTQHYLDVLTESNVERLYGDAMSALLAIQACTPSEGMHDYDQALLQFEMNLFVEWFLDRHLGVTLSPDQHQALEKCFTLLSRSATAQPQVFVHRDYHSRNLMVQQRHNPGILDFQGAVRGPVTYDLVSLLRDVYIEWPADRVHAWVAGYHDLAIQHGITEEDDPSRWLRWFDLMGVQRHIKVAGIFARLYHRDGKPGYVQDIPLALSYLITVCKDYSELHPLLTLLQKLQVSERLQEKNAQTLAD